MAPHLSRLSSVPRRRAWIWAFCAYVALCGHVTTWAAPDAGSGAQRGQRNTPLYACQDSAGRTTYSQFACTTGTAQATRQVAWHDARDARQLEHSTQMQRRERKLLQTIERDRQREAKSQEEARHGQAGRKIRSSVNDTQTDRPKRPQAEARPTRYRVLPPLTPQPPAPGSRLKP